MIITGISGNGSLHSSGLNLTIIVIFNKLNVKRNSISICLEKTNVETPLTIAVKGKKDNGTDIAE
jgi:hypothetical protein